MRAATNLGARLVAKAYLQGSFVMDVLGTFPLNIVQMFLNPDNPYGDAQLSAMQAEAAAGGGMDPGRANRTSQSGSNRLCHRARSQHAQPAEAPGHPLRVCSTSSHRSTCLLATRHPTLCPLQFVTSTQLVTAVRPAGTPPRE